MFAKSFRVNYNTGSFINLIYTAVHDFFYVYILKEFVRQVGLVQ